MFACVLGDADDELPALEPRHQVRVVRVHQRVGATRHDRPAFDRRPRPPRLGGDIDRELLAPVPVDLGDGGPLAADEPRLHRVLRPEPLHDRGRSGRVGAPAVGGAVLRRVPELACRARGPGTSPSPSAGRSRSRPRAPGSARTCSRTGRCAHPVWRWRTRTRGPRRRRALERTTTAAGSVRRTRRSTSARGASRDRRPGPACTRRAASPPRTGRPGRRRARRPSARTRSRGSARPCRARTSSGRRSVPRWCSVKHAPSWTSATLWTNDAWSRRVAVPAGSMKVSWKIHRCRPPPSGVTCW